MVEMEFIPDLFKVKNFARRIEASPSWVYEQIQAGEIHAVRIGGNIRIPRSELERLARKTLDDK